MHQCMSLVKRRIFFYRRKEITPKTEPTQNHVDLEEGRQTGARLNFRRRILIEFEYNVYGRNKNK